MSSLRAFMYNTHCWHLSCAHLSDRLYVLFIFAVR